MSQLATIIPDAIMPADESQQGSYLAALMNGDTPVEAANKAGSDALGIYLARHADSRFNQMVQLVELARRDEILAQTIRKALVASGQVAEVALRDPDTDQILLDEDFNPIKAPRLINGNAAILTKLLERLLASADKPNAPVQVNVQQNNHQPQGELVLIDPLEEGYADD